MKQTQSILRCGIDEAGRGALAGPLVAAAVMFPQKTMKTVTRRVGFRPRDSKTFSRLQRKKVYTALKRMRATIAVEIISTRQINNHGIGWANREIMRRLIKKLTADEYILDGNLKIGVILGKTNKIRSVPHADAMVPEVICASIVAKEERDALMRTLHKEYPQFLWCDNAGYGTAAHLRALKTHKMTKYHRGIYVTTALKHKNSVVQFSACD